MKWAPLKNKEPEKKSANMDPLDAYYDERGDDDWSERDLAKLDRDHGQPARNQKSTSDQSGQSGEPK